MRVVVFADFDNHGALVLVRALLAEVDRRAGWNVVALCEAGPAPARPEPGAADRVLARVRRAPLARPAIERLAARRQLTIIGARGRSLDTEAVTEEVVALEPDVGLSFASRQVFRHPLLRSVPNIVNLHDGLLPAYAGLSATSFSLYEGRAESGFTYHHMAEAVDAGPILLQGSVPVAPTDALRDVIDRKRALAGESLPRVLDLVAAGSRGTPQRGRGSYFSEGHTLALIRVEEPASLASAELERRIRAFGAVRLPTSTGPLWVTSARRDPGFLLPEVETADVRLYVDRVAGMPALVHRGARALRSMR